MIRSLIGIYILLATFSVQADTLKSKAELKPLSEKIMVQLAKGDAANAFKVIEQFMSIPSKEILTSSLESLSQRKKNDSRYGAPVGYELIKETNMGDSIIRHQYIEKRELHVIVWTFYYYKTPKGWILDTYTWNDGIQTLFQQ
ncbi:hypothetical protein ACO0LD_12715 [Undibacterium sp. Ji83W]|uniref:hypothetical protein n=1 Tax=Undibacterium TaxID=401469 RepID=UPI003BF31277